MLVCIGFPLSLLYILIRNHSRLDQAHVVARYSFLYHGYKPERSWFEVVILLRKLATCTATVFLSGSSAEGAVTLQLLAVLSILVLSYLVLSKARPYEVPLLMWLESLSLMGSTLVVFSGLLFSNDAVSASSKAATAGIVVAFQAYVYLVFIYALLLEARRHAIARWRIPTDERGEVRCIHVRGAGRWLFLGGVSVLKESISSLCAIVLLHYCDTSD